MMHEIPRSVVRLRGGGGSTAAGDRTSGLDALVENGELKRHVYTSGGVRVVTLSDGSRRCEECSTVVEAHGFQQGLRNTLCWTKCELVPGARVCVADLLASGWLSAAQHKTELLLSDGVARSQDVAGHLRADGCRWDFSSMAWRCSATADRRGALQTARSRMTPAELLQLRVEVAVGRPVQLWPARYRTAARAARIGYCCEKHASGVGRHAFCLFLVHNGCSPALLAEWLLSRDCVKSDAWCEIKATVSKLGRGQPCGTTWDLRTSQKLVAVMREAQKNDVERALEVMDNAAPRQCSAPAQRGPSGCAAYYASVFPLADVARLLHREGSPFQLREVALDSRVLRSRPVLSLQKLRGTMSQLDPTSVHVGPAHDSKTRAPRTSVARISGARIR